MRYALGHRWLIQSEYLKIYNLDFITYQDDTKTSNKTGLRIFIFYSFSDSYPQPHLVSKGFNT